MAGPAAHLTVADDAGHLFGELLLATWFLIVGVGN